jgi:hypothetical protein
MAEFRSWKHKVSKKLATITIEERQEYWRKGDEKLKAEGYNFG